jgi:hypothetical protein
MAVIVPSTAVVVPLDVASVKFPDLVVKWFP